MDEHVARSGRSRPSSLGRVSTTTDTEAGRPRMLGNIEADCIAGTLSILTTFINLLTNKLFMVNAGEYAYNIIITIIIII